MNCILYTYNNNILLPLRFNLYKCHCTSPRLTIKTRRTGTVVSHLLESILLSASTAVALTTIIMVATAYTLIVVCRADLVTSYLIQLSVIKRNIFLYYLHHSGFDSGAKHTIFKLFNSSLVYGKLWKVKSNFAWLKFFFSVFTIKRNNTAIITGLIH